MSVIRSPVKSAITPNQSQAMDLGTVTGILLDIQKGQRTLLEGQENMKTLYTELKSDISSIKDEITTVKGQQELGNTKIAALELKSKNIEDRVEGMTNYQAEVNERYDRLLRKNNIIIFGVQEDGEDSKNKTLLELWKLILPNENPIAHERFGKKLENATRPRPLRVYLSNPIAKRNVFKNCKKLKGIDMFKGVSIQSDKTYSQRKEEGKDTETTPDQSDSMDTNAVPPQDLIRIKAKGRKRKTQPENNVVSKIPRTRSKTSLGGNSNQIV